MTKLLLSLHVLAAIIAVGPVTVAASMFPPAARKALAAPEDERAGSAVRLLHRICRVYAGIGIAVPVLGFATASAMGVMGDTWLIVSTALTVAAALVLVVLVLPRQEVLVEGGGDQRTTVQLGMFTGMFNLLWATVTVLMIVRPGSTTGA
ncbi:hypothetical protein DF268_29400 [Streptomyces sp. V2]|uniref:hypothetical protein n=1 Tax=Streptomyces TaxID=1883 RepID=UPI0006EB7BDD|nr:MULTISPECIES: hypothetical protein [Streptomyces]PWG09996.1 hypothetical protein DF268_29400 [Streptomyces sp. V2]